MQPIIRVHDKNFQPYLSAAEIAREVARVGAEISTDYAGKRPLCISILNGSFMFAADLFRHITCEPELCCIKLASYKGTKSTGNVITSIGLDVEVVGRDIIIIEDIIDTGRTLGLFIPTLLRQQPASLKIAALLHKPDAMQHPLNINYLGFSIPDKFVVGYGLDYDGLGRNIPEIYQLAE